MADISNKLDEATDKIVAWIKQKIEESHTDGVVVGLSGGVDSALTAVLCKRACPDNILGVILPCNSSKTDREHAELVAKQFDILFEVVGLESTFNTLTETLRDDSSVPMAVANIKPRLRMTALYYFANKLNRLVVGTDNKSESMTGYFTKYGDGGVDILPLSDLYKYQVRELAAHVGVPKEIIEKPPSAGLWDDQTDEGEMGLSYNDLDRILEKMEKDGSMDDEDPAMVDKVKKIIAQSEHKRNLPPVCKI